jgi:hypothetical protein
MPRYYFNLRDAGELIPDHEGIELADHADAQKQAIRGLADCARDAIADAAQGDLAIEVVDNLGNLLLVAKLVFATEFLETSDKSGTHDPDSQRSSRDSIGKSGQPNYIKHRNLSS